MAGAAAVAVSDPLQLLDRAVSLVINGWHVLQVAVENSLGGPQSREKAEWMVEVTTKYLSNNAGVHTYDIEDFLDAILDQEFDTLVEDGSLSEVAKQLHELCRQLREGKVEEVRQFVERSPKPPAASVPAEHIREDSMSSIDTEDDEEEEMEEEAVDKDEEEETVHQLTNLKITMPSPSGGSGGEEVKIDGGKAVPSIEATTDVAKDEGWEVVRRGRRRSKGPATT